MICGSGGSKSRLAKAAGAEPAGQMRDEKLHAVVARSTFPSQNVQNTSASDHFWKLRCRKSARCCGAKHISNSKRTKHTIVGLRCWKVHALVARSTFRSQNVQKRTRSGPLLAVEMSKKKKCTPLCREAHFEVKMLKTPGVRTAFGGSDVEKVHAVVARSTFRSQNVKNTRGSDHFWKFRCRFAWQAQGIVHLVQKWVKREGFVAFSTTTTTTPHYTPIHYTTLQLQLHLHSTTLHCAQLHSITLHYITLHYTPLHYTTLRYTTLPSTTLHYITLHYTPQHYNYNYTTTLHYTPLH